MEFLNRISKSKYFWGEFHHRIIDHVIDFIDHRMDFIDHEFISKHLGDFFAKSSIITITIIIDVPRTARALLAVKNYIANLIIDSSTSKLRKKNFGP